MARKQIDKKILKTLNPLGQLGADKLNEIAEKSVQEDYPAGRILFRQGERDKRAMYVLSGQVELSSTGKSRSSIIKGKSPEANSALAPELPRTCTARTKTNATILFVDNDLLEILLADDQSGFHSYEVTEISAESDGGDWMLRFLQSRAFLNLPTENIQSLLMRMEEVAAKKGEVIVKQGERDDYYYIIKSGSCQVSRRPAPKANDVPLATLTHGEGFGEEALITLGKRNASVTMMEDGVVMRVHKDDFIPLLVEPLINAVDGENAQRLLAAGSKLIDVRTHHQFSRDGLERAVNIPLSMLRSKLGSLDPIHNYLLYCDDGSRSSAAAFLLSQQGLQCSILKDGLTASGATLPRKTSQAEDTTSEPAEAPAAPTQQQPTATGPTSAHEAAPAAVAPVAKTVTTAQQAPASAPSAHSAPDLDIPARAPQPAASARHEQVQRSGRTEQVREKAEANSQRLQREAEALKSRSRNLAQRTASAEAAQRDAEMELERIKQEEQARRATQLGAAKKRVEEEMRRARAAEQARKQAEAARITAEEEARRIQAQNDTLRDKDIKQARQRAEAEARRAKSAELASRKAMEDAERARTEAETLRKQSQQEIERLRVEAEATRRKAEQELERVRVEAEEASRRQAALEEERKRAGQEAAEAARAADLARRESQEEAGRLRAEAEAIRQQAQQEAEQLREQMEQARREMAEEAARVRAEAEQTARARTEAEEATRIRVAEEEAARARAEAEQAARSRAEAETQLQRARAEAEEAARRIKAEAEEAARARAEAEATLVQARVEASALKQRAAEEEQAQRRAEEEHHAQRRAAKEQARRAAKEQARRAEEEQARRAAEEEARRAEEAERAARRRAEAEAAARHKALQEAAARQRAEEAEAARQEALRRREEERARRAKQLAAEAQAKQLAEAIVGQLQEAERTRQEQTEHEPNPGLSMSRATVREVKGRTILEGDEDIFVFQAPKKSPPPGTEEPIPVLSEAQAVESTAPISAGLAGSADDELPSFIIETDDITMSMDTRREDTDIGGDIFEFREEESADEDPASVVIDTSAPAPARGVTVPERFVRDSGERRGGKAWWGIAAGVLLVGALGFFALTQESYVDVQQVAAWFGDKQAPQTAAEEEGNLATRRLAQFASARRQAEKVARSEAESEYKRLLAVWKTRIAPGLTERRADEVPTVQDEVAAPAQDEATSTAPQKEPADDVTAQFGEGAPAASDAADNGEKILP
ncbi:MAG: cyclic nucleotide-binding domain-containing protein [Pseudomonadota bacterium]|nr:MAG: cyclic nucleotide-binding domain-containing protein [Pseudomonadota bacterium]